MVMTRFVNGNKSCNTRARKGVVFKINNNRLLLKTYRAMTIYLDFQKRNTVPILGHTVCRENNSAQAANSSK